MKIRLLFLLLLLFAALGSRAETLFTDSVGILDSGRLTARIDTIAFDRVAVECRAAWKSDDSSWALFLASGADTISVSLTRSTTARFTDYESTVAVLAVTCGDSLLLRKEFEKGFDIARGDFNSLGISLEAGHLAVTGGSEGSDSLAAVPVSSSFRPAVAGVSTVEKVDVSSLAIYCDSDPVSALMTAYDPDRLRAMKPGKAIEGVWEYLDRENDPRYARLGGRYTLAIVAAPDGGCFDIVYLDGAEINSPSWRPGMLKGRLRPTRFRDHYDLEWIDSTFTPRTRDLHATLDPATKILTLTFPLLHTQLRLFRK